MNLQNFLNHPIAKKIYLDAGKIALEDKTNYFKTGLDEYEVYLDKIFQIKIKKHINEIKHSNEGITNIYNKAHDEFYDIIYDNFDWDKVITITNPLNEVFTIGDEICFIGKRRNKFTIKRFGLSSENAINSSIPINKFFIDVYVEEGIGEPLSSFEYITHYNEPILKTFDDVDIYIGENFWCFNPETNVCHVTKIRQEIEKDDFISKGWMAFSSNEAYNEYKFLNTKLSISEFVEFIQSNKDFRLMGQPEYLKMLLKKFINKDN